MKEYGPTGIQTHDPSITVHRCQILTQDSPVTTIVLLTRALVKSA